MNFDFGILPPEINSGRIYCGPGSGPLLASAAAWDALAAELDVMATHYSTVVAELTDDPWRGPASTSMAGAATRDVAWMRQTAALATQAANQAKAAAGAYEAAFAMTVPPPVIAANRALKAGLTSTNFLGQNTPAIAATEAQYGEMWAQDVVAMHRYAVSSASASKLTPFATPPQTAKVSASTIGQIITNVDLLATDLIFTANLAVASASLGVATASFARTSATDTNTGAGSQQRLVAYSGKASGVIANTGRAATVGRLSVPPSWGYSPAIRQLAAVVPSTIAQPAPGPANDLVLANLAGSTLGGLTTRGGFPARTAPSVRRTAHQTTASTQVATQICAADIPENLAVALAAMPGATVVLIPPSPPATPRGL